MCALGQFYNREEENCQRCPHGTYSSAQNLDKCLSCPTHYTSPEGSTSIKDCFGKSHSQIVVKGNLKTATIIIVIIQQLLRGRADLCLILPNGVFNMCDIKRNKSPCNLIVFYSV